jgi:hypothetical protein
LRASERQGVAGWSDQKYGNAEYRTILVTNDIGAGDGANADDGAADNTEDSGR